MIDLIDPAGPEACLPELNRCCGALVDLEILDCCASTQDEVFQRLEVNRTKPVCVISRIQTAGRGRRRRIWDSPDGGIWLSIGARISRDLRDADQIIAPVAKIMHGIICDAAGDRAGTRPCRATVTLKSPNDILLNEAKVCGILSESHSNSTRITTVVIGVGINYRNRGQRPDYAYSCLADYTDCSATEIAGRTIAGLAAFIRDQL